MSVKACIYIGELYSCSNEPFVYTINPRTAIAVNDEVASLTVAAPATSEVYIRMGTWLHFGSNYIVVAKDTVITSVATAVDIEPATRAVALSDTALTWSLQRVLASNSYLNTSKFTVTTSDLENRGFEAIIHPASQSNQSIYTLIVHNGHHTFGRAQVGSLSYRDKSAKFEVFFQAPFGNAVLFTAQSTYRQAQLNKLRQLAGLPVLVAQ